ncbi:putative RING-H2 finger protein ATL19, partial [Cucurbita argyrosperma subsp. sororia]
MPIIVLFGFVLTVLVLFSFFSLCIYICFQCHTQGFIGATQTHRDNGHGMATRAATRAATVNPEELNHQTHRVMEKLTMPLVDYGCKENDGEVASSELNECAICLEAFGNRVSCRVFPNCKHMFHTHCIIKWLGINLTCPICRTHL